MSGAGLSPTSGPSSPSSRTWASCRWCRQVAPLRRTEYRRTGTVRARRLNGRRPWTRRSGDQLHGDAGDWRVIDGGGDERTVRDPEFRHSHEPLGGDFWLRTGNYRAWRVSQAVVLRTREGRATALPGDWVVEGPGANAGRSPTTSSGAVTPPRPGSRQPGHTPLRTTRPQTPGQAPRAPTPQTPTPHNARPQTARPQTRLPRTARPYRPHGASLPTRRRSEILDERRRRRRVPGRELPLVIPQARFDDVVIGDGSNSAPASMTPSSS